MMWSGDPAQPVRRLIEASNSVQRHAVPLSSESLEG